MSDTHLTLDAAIKSPSDVSLQGWLSEWDVCNPLETKPERPFRLYIILGETPRLVAAPDASFLLSSRGFRKTFYLEQDRGTSGVRQIAVSKTTYLGVAACGKPKRHFRETNVDSL